MAKNDYFVIVYKILSYLYECMKAGKEPAQEDIACDSQLFHISQRYWNHIMSELVAREYVIGIYEVETLGMHGFVIGRDAAITRSGMQFLEENSMMHKVKKFLGKGFELSLGTMISLL